jgi:outer membrane protein assembly factor BamB
MTLKLRLAGCLVGPCVLAASGQYSVLTFHGDSQRTGWISSEKILTPDNVSAGAFGPVWDSPALDSVVISGKIYPPHLYASPLYVDRVTITGDDYAGVTFHVVYAASSNGFVYAVNASRGTVRPRRGGLPHRASPGEILWKRQLNMPSGAQDVGVPPGNVPGGTLDGGVPLGIMGTPVIDLKANPPRLYVASADATQGWQVFALDITNGDILPGWPLNINDATLSAINQNGPARFQPAGIMSQRGALNLSPDGRLLYVPFGAYFDSAVGWMVAVDTQRPALASAFSGAPSSVAFANGGMWASGGPAVDLQGNVYSTTGNGTLNTMDAPGYWAQSVLEWGPGSPLRLVGTYTPWNYCQMDKTDIDLAGGSAIVLPDLAGANTSTPHLITFGGKQGNQYLVDRDHMPGSLVSRPACSGDPATDRSLVPPGPQPQFSKPAPLNVFGPYTENFGSLDYARGRSTGAFFHSADGGNFLFVSGSSKAAADSQQTTPPCIVKLRINTSPGSPAYLSVEASENSFHFLSPGSPWVTSNGGKDAIVWLLVGNVARSTLLTGPDVPHPILYALDPVTLRALWISTPLMLNVGGKYNTPAFGPGMVFVGTDRIQAFGLEFDPSAPSQRIGR